MERIEHVLNNEGSLKVVERKLGIAKNQMYALIATNMDKMVKVAKHFYRHLYSNRDNEDNNGRASSPQE